MVDNAVVSASVIAVVALISLALFAVTHAARRRTGSPRLLLVSLGFLVFFAKGLAVSAILVMRWLPHDLLEILEASLDLVVILLMAAPVFVRGNVP